MGRNHLVTEERNRDLFEAYKNVIKRHGPYASLIPKYMLYRETVNSMAPKFYLSEIECGRIVCKMLKEEAKSGNQGDYTGEREEER